MSQMCGKLGTQVAGSKVTAIDDGTIPNAWGSCNIDDEGRPNQRRVLIENGILKSYMIDRLGARRMGMEHTASGRRQNYSFETTSRMTNTFIAPAIRKKIFRNICKNWKKAASSYTTIGLPQRNTWEST